MPLDGDWTPECCQYFKDITNRKTLVSFVVKVDKDNSDNELELKLYDTSGDDDKHVDELLISENHAKIVL